MMVQMQKDIFLSERLRELPESSIIPAFSDHRIRLGGQHFAHPQPIIQVRARKADFEQFPHQYLDRFVGARKQEVALDVDEIRLLVFLAARFGLLIVDGNDQKAHFLFYFIMFDQQLQQSLDRSAFDGRNRQDAWRK